MSGYHIDGYDDEERSRSPRRSSIFDDLDAASDFEDSEDSEVTSDLFGSHSYWNGRGGKRRKKKKKKDAHSSLSDYWGGRFGGFGGWFGGGSRWGSSAVDSKTQLRVRALQAIRRVGSIVYGSAVSKDFSFRSSTTQRVTLNDRMLQDESLGWSEGRRVDALMGNALAEASMIRHGVPCNHYFASARKLHRFPAARDQPRDFLAQSAQALGQVANWIFATQKVHEEFPGYGGYFDTEREFRHNPKAQADYQSTINQLLSKGKVHAAAVLATLWRTLAPERPVETPFDPVIESVSTEMRSAVQAATDKVDLLPIVERTMVRLLKEIEPPPPQEGGGGGDDDDDADGEGGGGGGGASGAAGEGDADGSEGGSESESESEAHASTMAALMDAAESLGLEKNTAGIGAEEAEQIEDFVEREYKEEDKEGVLKESLEYHGLQAPLVSIWAPTNGASTARYQSTLKEIQPFVHRTRESFRFRNEIARMDELGLRRGIVDEGAMHKLAYGDPRIFRRQDIVSSPSVHLGLLVDESGSMGGQGEHIARQCAILLHEATARLEGVATSVWGHTANAGRDYGAMSEGGCTVLRYLERDRGRVESLGGIRARANNLDGFAIAYAGRRMRDLAQPNEQQILFVLADGYPSGSIIATDIDEDGEARARSAGYGSTLRAGVESGITHTRREVQRLRRQGVQVQLLAMGDHFNESYAEAMYGANHFEVIRNMGEVPRVLAKLMERALKTGQV